MSVEDLLLSIKIGKHVEIPKEDERNRKIYVKSIRHYKSLRLKTRTAQCDICGFVPPREFSTMLQTHHFIPYSQGGGNTFDNFLLVCPNCHYFCHRIIRASDNLTPNTRKAFIWFARQLIDDYEGVRQNIKRIFQDTGEDLLVDDGSNVRVDVERLFELTMDYLKIYKEGT